MEKLNFKNIGLGVATAGTHLDVSGKRQFVSFLSVRDGDKWRVHATCGSLKAEATGEGDRMFIALKALDELLELSF